jgi:hypothetical protein
MIPKGERTSITQKRRRLVKITRKKWKPKNEQSRFPVVSRDFDKPAAFLVPAALLAALGLLSGFPSVNNCFTPSGQGGYIKVGGNTPVFRGLFYRTVSGLADYPLQRTYTGETPSSKYRSLEILSTRQTLLISLTPQIPPEGPHF